MFHFDAAAMQRNDADGRAKPRHTRDEVIGTFEVCNREFGERTKVLSEVQRTGHAVSLCRFLALRRSAIHRPRGLGLGVALMFICSARKLFALCMPMQFAAMELTRNCWLRLQSVAAHVDC